MATTVQVSDEIKKELETLKDYPRQTYNEVIQKLVHMYEIIAEDRELRDDLLRDLKEARKEAKQGKVITLEQLEKELLA